MHSNHFEESDRRPVFLCPVCLRKLQHSCHFEPLSRYRRMRQFWWRAGMQHETRWLDRTIGALEPFEPCAPASASPEEDHSPERDGQQQQQQKQQRRPNETASAATAVADLFTSSAPSLSPSAMLPVPVPAPMGLGGGSASVPRGGRLAATLQNKRSSRELSSRAS